MNLAGLRHYSMIVDGYVSDITSNSLEYFKIMTKGWPFSRKFQMHSIYDYRQYSNEIFKTTSHPTLMSYPEWEVSNLHSYHKYYLGLLSALPAGSGLSFKGSFDVFRAFLANSNFSSKIGPLFFELLSQLKFSLKIFFSRVTFRNV